MGGLSKTMRITAGTFAIGTLALTGCPGLAGFFSKDAILVAAFDKSMPLFCIAWAAAFLTAFYMTRLFVVAFLGKPRTEAAHHGHDCPARMTVPLVILAVLAVVAGWGTESIFVSQGHGPEDKSHFIPASLAFFAFIAGTAVAYTLYKGKDREPLSLPLFRHKFYFDEIYGAIVAGTQDVFAFIANGIDTAIGAVARGLGMVAWGGGFVLRLFQIGNVQAYSFIFGLGVVGLIWFLIFR